MAYIVKASKIRLNDPYSADKRQRTYTYLNDVVNGFGCNKIDFKNNAFCSMFNDCEMSVNFHFNKDTTIKFY